MNANELADELEAGAKLAENHATIAIRVIKAATMLRQQQAEIEALKAKTLTDEEIQEIAHDYGEIGWLGDTTYEFARAILRKAQEK